MKRTTRLKTRKPRTGNRTPLAEGMIPLNSHGHRDWLFFTDDALVSYANNFMKENEIIGRKELEKADRGLYYVLRKRRLLDIIGFEEKTRKGRPWKKMKDDEIIEHAKGFMKEKGIRGRAKLYKADPGLYKVLSKRGLLDRIGFEEKKRSWEKMKDEEVIEYAKKLMKEKGISGRKELETADPGLYMVLRIRKLLDRVGFEEKIRKRRPWKKTGDEELIEHAKSFMKENGITGRFELEKADCGLYEALRKRILLDRAGFEEKKRPWKKMKDEEIIEFAKKVMKENGISGRKELENADYGLCDALRKRGLLDKLEFEKKRRKKRSWKQMKDDEIVEYSTDFMNGNGITGRSELEKADCGLYNVLRKRKLLDFVFSHIEKSASERAIEQIIDFTAGFGERG